MWEERGEHRKWEDERSVYVKVNAWLFGILLRNIFIDNKFLFFCGKIFWIFGNFLRMKEFEKWKNLKKYWIFFYIIHKIFLYNFVIDKNSSREQQSRNPQFSTSAHNNFLHNFIESKKLNWELKFLKLRANRRKIFYCSIKYKTWISL